MRYFVRVQDGKVISEPAVISDERTASPNTMWSPGQMALNGMVEVDIECGPMETVDLAHPHYENGVVTYDRIQKVKPQEEIDREAEVAAAQEAEFLIQKKIRDLAVTELQADGHLDNEGKITDLGKAEVVSIKAAADLSKPVDSTPKKPLMG